MNPIQTNDNKIIELTSHIVSAYVTNNEIEADKIPTMIDQVFETLTNVKKNIRQSSHTTQKPAVPIEDSLTDEYLICLEDGKRFKMMKRHLRATFKMTPDEYRKKWQLPPTYPMVAPNYAIRRSLLAEQIGLGKGKTHHRKKITQR